MIADRVDSQRVMLGITVCKLSFTVLFLTHVVACLWYSVSITIHQSGAPCPDSSSTTSGPCPTWVERHGMTNPNKIMWNYMSALHWAATQVCAANKMFEISKFKFEFPRARTYEMIGLVLGCIEAKFCK